MSPTLSLSLLWVGFALTHTMPSSRSLRPRLVARLGLVVEDLVRGLRRLERLRRLEAAPRAGS